MPSILEAVFLGIVEGLTEFLPVSSTGHLIITSHFFGSDSSGAFEIMIQTGAILAVIWHYRESFFSTVTQFFKGHRPSQVAWLKVFVAFLPAAVIGLSFASQIKSYLFGVTPVIGALIVGGIAMIIIERRSPHPRLQDSHRLGLLELSEALSFKQALSIGFFQCLAMWPGTSRSMATILGGRLIGLSASQAAAFSFWLAMPTLIGAGVYDGVKHYKELLQEGALASLAVGLVVSYIVALLVIRAFLNFLKSHSLEIFGWYRIVFGISIWLLL